MSDLTSFFDSDIVALSIKIFFLILIGLYLVFVIIVFNQVRSLRRIIIIASAAGSPLIQSLALFYLIATISLFVAALVIL